MKLRNRNAVLFIIVIAQFLCTSLWFASNGILHDLITNYSLSESALGHLTTAIQFGFICGTLVFAVYRIADRYSPSFVFLWCAIVGALANACVILPANTFTSLLALRFLTGFFLAGVYPVGMKIAADYFEQGLGKALGLLVAALVVGTGLPHFLRYVGSELDWRFVLISVSVLAIAGGVLVGWLVKDGPYRRTGQGVDFKAMMHVLSIRKFRKASFGYFGHMWELYAFWAFVPVILTYYQRTHLLSRFDISLWSFVVIGIGGVACVLNGYLSNRIGPVKAAVGPLMISAVCCAISPMMLQHGSLLLFLTFMIIWGMTVVADSPMFSTLVAQEAPAELRGTALTLVVCIGFAITILSIQLLNWLSVVIETQYLFLFLVPGPVAGLLGMMDSGNKRSVIVK